MSALQTRKSPAATGLQDRTSNASYTHGSPIDRLLPLLKNVRKYGAGWRADCPNGHEKVRGSLSITEADGGNVLMKCFACGDTRGALAAIGLELADLFPERIKDPSPEARKAAHEAFKRNGWAAALGVLAREATVIEIAAHDLADNKVLSEADHDRLLVACSRIHGARAVLQ
jgi:hypothetical protein